MMLCVCLVVFASARLINCVLACVFDYDFVCLIVCRNACLFVWLIMCVSVLV